MSRTFFFLAMLLASLRCHAELELLTHTISPDKRLAFAVGEHDDRLWLVRLPSLTPIGNSLPVRDFRGLPGHGGAVWYPTAQRVAVVEGGIPYGETRVFQYSSNLLRELPLPDLEALPRRWFPTTAATAKQSRIYITARRWHGPKRLELTVSGRMSPMGLTEPPYDSGKDLEYDFSVLVEFNREGGSRIIHVHENT